MIWKFILAAMVTVMLPAAVALTAGNPERADKAPVFDVITVNSAITPPIAEYVLQSIEESAKSGAEGMILRLDTPGGLDLAMRDIAKGILNAPLPVIVYVAPAGARAASAGVIITAAAHIAAMAPGTNIGAAHPVNVGGGAMDNTMSQKVENDAAAYARSLAARAGRNADWAESAVRESASLSAKDALEKKVIDLVVSDLRELLQRVDGREVRKGESVLVVRTKGAEVARFPMGLRHRVLSALADPNIAYILLMIGIYGIYFELASPGAVFPGVVGGISLVLGFYALQTLSANYAGFLLILLSVILFFLELKIQSHGALAIGGIVAMTLGSLMLFRSSAEPFLRVSWSVLITMIGLSAAFFGVVISLAVRSQFRKPATGAEGMIGETGEAATDIDGKGKVQVVGELWDARCDRPVRKGEPVTVKDVRGMTLIVEPGRPGDAEPKGR